MSNEIRIFLDNEWAVPGDTVTGKVGWFCEKQPKKIILRLNWHTTGRGTTDKGTVDEENIICTDSSGEASFSLRTPSDSPYSYYGKLVSIIWEVEAIADIAWKIDPKTYAPIVISPTGEPLSPPQEWQEDIE